MRTKIFFLDLDYGNFRSDVPVGAPNGVVWVFGEDIKLGHHVIDLVERIYFAILVDDGLSS